MEFLQKHKDFIKHGNTCYLNSVLQLFINSTEIMNLISIEENFQFMKR